MHEFMRSTECGCVCSVPCVTVDVYLYGVCELCVHVEHSWQRWQPVQARKEH